MVKLLVVCVFIIILLMLRRSLWIVMLSATLLLGILYRMQPWGFMQAVFYSLISPTTIQVCLVMVFIMFLEYILNKNGYLDKTLNAMTNLIHNRRIILAAMPILVGLLPSAGGALFSAPFVEKVAGNDLNGHDKAFANTYYRHIMELFLPTYQTVLIIVTLSGVSYSGYVWAMFMIAVIQALLGVNFLKRLPKEITGNGQSQRKDQIKDLLISLWPFLLMLTMILGFNVPVHYAVGVTLFLTFIITKSDKEDFKLLFTKYLNYKMLLILLSILVFKDLLTVSGALDQLPDAVSKLPVPAYLVFGISAFLICLFTGIILPGVAITIPMAIIALPEAGIPLAMLLTVFAYAGNMISPMHLCLIVTNEYFGSDLISQVKRALPRYILICLITVIIYLVWINFF